MLRKQILTGRRPFLCGLGTLIGMGVFTVAAGLSHWKNQMQALADQERDFTVVGEDSLRERAAAKGLIYGGGGEYYYLLSDSKFAVHLAKECAILVPASEELKWKGLRPSPDSFDFTAGDWLTKFAHAHGMLFRGHTLVWQQALPGWFEGTVNSKNAKQMLLKHIATVVGHYAGKVHSWDVVNEAIDPTAGRADGLRKTPWLEFLGPDYIDLAFRAAAEADPLALLLYNDFGLEYNGREDEVKRTAVLRLLERLKSRGTPVHALGMQAHLWADKTRFNFRHLKAFLHDVAGLGLKILITEMDVTDQKLPSDIDVRDRIVAGVYEDFLSVVLEQPAVIGVLTWGLSDHYTWLSATPRRDGLPVRTLPLDAQLKRKLVWNAIARAFDKAPKR